MTTAYAPQPSPVTHTASQHGQQSVPARHMSPTLRFDLLRTSIQEDAKSTSAYIVGMVLRFEPKPATPVKSVRITGGYDTIYATQPKVDTICTSRKITNIRSLRRGALSAFCSAGRLTQPGRAILPRLVGTSGLQNIPTSINAVPSINCEFLTMCTKLYIHLVKSEP